MNKFEKKYIKEKHGQMEYYREQLQHWIDNEINISQTFFQMVDNANLTLNNVIDMIYKTWTNQSKIALEKTIRARAMDVLEKKDLKKEQKSHLQTLINMLDRSEINTQIMSFEKQAILGLFSIMNNNELLLVMIKGCNKT